MFATLLSWDFLSRIYWNVKISFKGVNITHEITHHKQFEEMRLSTSPWYMIIDEIWMNFNSKDAVTKKNKAFSNFLFLQWKYNLSTIWLAQRWNSIPVDFRELATRIFEVKKILRSWKHPLFAVIQYKLMNDWELEFVREDIVDMISILSKWDLSYDTLETSYIE